ncbi:MAG: hypothetical protein K6G43_00320 [Lachnospiraceae bacterium]|nr:hypothetical protein [Lachnospiraceae bacterium]
MNNAIAVVAFVVIVFVIGVFFKSIISSVSGFVSKLPQWVRFVGLVVALIVAIVLLGHIFDQTKIFGSPGNPDGTVTDVGNSLEDGTHEQTENTIVLSGDQIWIDGESTDLAGAERYISGFSGSDQTLIIQDDYSTSYIHHMITDICSQNNVIPKCIDDKGNEQ